MKVEISIYKSYGFETAIELIGNQQLTTADIQHGLSSLYGKLKRSECYEINDTSEINELIKETGLPKNMDFFWEEKYPVPSYSFFSPCFYNKNPYHTETAFINKITRKNRKSNDYILDITFLDTKEWELITEENISKQITFKIGNHFVGQYNLISKISNGKSQIIVHEDILKEILPNYKNLLVK